MSGAADGLPPLATTGIGSLPFVSAANGTRHAVRAYEIPFCPQLPALDGDMVREWLGTGPRRCGWSLDRDRERPAAWNAFLTALAAVPAGTRRQTRIVKLQVTGPMTLAIAWSARPVRERLQRVLELRAAPTVTARDPTPPTTPGRG